MTYIERAFADFTKSVIKGGITSLTHPKYLPFSISALTVVFMNTFMVFFGNNFGIDLATEGNVKFLISLEISMAIGFVLSGLLLSRLNYLTQLLGMIIFTMISFSLFYLDIIEFNSIGYIAAFLFIVWIILGTLSQYSFFRDFFGHPVIGGILFLGKAKDDGKIIFRGIIMLVTLFNIGLGYLIITDALAVDLPVIYIILGAIIVFAGFVNLLPLFHVQSRGDVFFSTLTWFYSLSTIRVVYLAFRLLSQNDLSNNVVIDLSITLFLILVAVHKATSSGKKIGKRLEEEKTLEIKEKKKRRFKPEKNPVNAVINKIFQDRGIVLIILGSSLGYHTTIVQFRLGQFNVLSDNQFNANLHWTVISHQVAIFTMLAVYLLTLFFFVFSSGFRKYSNPDIVRLTWLPPYDDMKGLIIGIKDGKVDYKIDGLKLLLSIGKDQLAKSVGFKKSTDHESKISGALNKLIGKSRK
jgi:hypothetical protein